MMLATVSTEAWSWAELARVLTFRGGYNTAVVVAGTTMLGVAAGLIGVFALLRKRALMGDALAHATLPGIALSFLMLHAFGAGGKQLGWLLFGAAITSVIGVVCVQAMVRYTRLRADAAIGAVLSVLFGVGIVLLSIVQDLPGAAGLHRFIYGQTAAMRQVDALVIGGVALVALAAAGLLFKEFRLVCFDDRFAASIGLPVGRIDLCMMALVVVVTVIGLQAVGLLLIVAMLIVPAAAARFWTNRMSLLAVLSAVIGGLSGYLGSAISALAEGLPAGAVIVLTAGGLFAASLLLAPARGVIAAGIRRVRLRARIGTDHVLRAMYEAVEASGAPAEQVELGGGAVPVERVLRARGWGAVRGRALLGMLRARGLLSRADGHVRLTARGAEEAQRVTRNHRLWEVFLVRHADLAASHVDRAADLVEHALSPELVAELEAILRAEGDLLGRETDVQSVHPIGAPGRKGGHV